MPQVEVTFDIDANGILHVTARDKASGKEQKITVTASTNLNKQDIEKMVQEARQHESEDKKRKEIIEVRNTADNLAYQTEKALKDLGDKVSADERSKIESKVGDLRAAAQTEDVDNIKKLTEDLQNAFYALSQQLYSQGQPQPETEGGSGPSTPPPADGDGSEGDVIEGEVKDA